jgi:hypothetical protein
MRITSFQRHWASFLEKRFREHVRKMTIPKDELGLVTRDARSYSSIPLEKHPYLDIVPSIGPLCEHTTLLTPDLISLPALALPADADRPEFFVRLPSGSLMKLFRRGCYPRMSTYDITCWPYRVVSHLRTTLDESQDLTN